MSKISLNGLINFAKQGVDDFTFKVKNAKDPKKKRGHQYQLDFWSSIYENLTKLKKLTDEQN